MGLPVIRAQHNEDSAQTEADVPLFFMKNWMAELATHYEKTRLRYSNEKLAIVFDIDGTILDMRYMVYHVLQAYDHSHRTSFFRELQVSDITVNENRVNVLLAEMKIEPDRQASILTWYTDHRW